MKQTPLFLSCCAVLAAIAFAGCASKSAPVTTPVTPEAPPPAEPVFEVTVPLLARSGSAVSGTVAFRESAGSVAVKLALAGVTPGLHGFHVHEVGDCSAPDGTSAGGHFNPHGANHGASDVEARHAGDMGNVEADAAGNVTAELTITGITLTPGLPHSIGGRSLILHAAPDDYVTQPTGNAGARIGCGVIDQSLVIETK
ncbi:MAG: superoxide dismutase family protein [Myxococcales bacterium]|nr:superoxide dismutase family protein [Myxococcales bacterium]